MTENVRTIIVILGLLCSPWRGPLAEEQPNNLEEQIQTAASSFVEATVRKKAIESLCARRPEKTETEDKIVAALGKALADVDDSDLRLGILERLDKSPSAAVADAVAGALKKELKEEALVSKALEVFTKRSSAQHLELLLELARQEHPSVRAAAVKAIDAINNVTALNSLLDLIETALKEGAPGLAEAALGPIALRMQHQLDEWQGDEGFEAWAGRMTRLLPRIAGLQKEKLTEDLATVAGAFATPGDLKALARLGMKDAASTVASRWASRISYQDLTVLLTRGDETSQKFALAALERKSRLAPPQDLEAFYSALLQNADDVSSLEMMYRVLSSVPVVSASAKTKDRILAKARTGLSHESAGPFAAGCVNLLGGNEEDVAKAQAAIDRLARNKGVSIAEPSEKAATEAASDLIRYGDPRLLPLWRKVMDKAQDDFESRSALVRSLWCCRSPETSKLLLGLLNDRFAPVRVAAAETLKHFHSKAGTDALLGLLEKDDWEVQMAVSQTLAWYPDPKVDEAVVSLLASPNWRIRAAAVLTLGRRRQPSAVEAIAKCAEDRPVCRYALEALGLQGTPEATKCLLSLLTASSDPNVLCFGMETVARFGVREADPILRKLLKDDSQEISRAARKALFELHFKGLGQATK